MLRLRGAFIGALATLVAATTLSVTGPATAAPSASPSVGSAGVPAYDHIFEIVEENHGFKDVIGNPAAPNLNALASQFGLETNYFGVTHPSEPNYVALLGGNYFGIQDDNPYYLSANSVNQPSLISQLDGAGIPWKAYLQGLPEAGYQGICYPLKCNGAPDSDPLFASKHDAIQNFVGSRTPADWNRQVPLHQLAGDLTANSVPRFNYIVPTECDDQHGDPPFCIDSGNPDSGNLATADPQDQRLVAQGDALLGRIVSQITSAPFWAQGNNAVAITYDEGDDNQGCCDAGNGNINGAGGGQVATVVITSHGPRNVKDNQPANHYSLLQTIQDSFGLGCLQFTCDTSHVKPLSDLLFPSGSTAVATKAITPPEYATPTPTPAEPQSLTTSTASSGGWTTVPSPLLGTNDNGLGAVAGSGPNDIWAVGNFVPDTASSNQDATLSLADHYNGVSWTAVPTPNGGPNFNTLFGVADSGGKAWAVGVDLNAAYQTRALVEAWNGTSWNIVDVPQPGTKRDVLYGITALSPTNVWAVGEQQSTGTGFRTLIEHFDGSSWSVVPSPNPGAAGDHLYGIAAAGGNDIWAVGQQLSGSAPDQPLIEHWNGTAWSVVTSPTLASGTNALYSVAVGPAGVYAAGEADDDLAGAAALIEHLSGTSFVRDNVPSAPGLWTNLWGISVAGNTVWAVGTDLNPTTGNNDALTLEGIGSNWTFDNGPQPGSGSNILGGVATIGTTAWAAGLNDQGGSNLTFLEQHPA